MAKRNINTCLFSCRDVAFNRSCASTGSFCNTVPINGTLAVFIRSVMFDEPLLYDDISVISLPEVAFLILGFNSLDCCDYKIYQLTFKYIANILISPILPYIIMLVISMGRNF